MLRTTQWTRLIFRVFFFFSPHDVLRTCQHEGVPLYRGEGYHKRMRTGQFPTKMDNAQDPHSPHLMHIALRMSRHPVVKPQSTTVETNNIAQIVKMFIKKRIKIQRSEYECLST